MTIEELLELPADDIAKLTTAQLEQHLHPYFPLTRPADLSPLPTSNDKIAPELQARIEELMAAKGPSILDKLKAKTV